MNRKLDRYTQCYEVGLACPQEARKLRNLATNSLNSILGDITLILVRTHQEYGKKKCSR